MIRPEMLPGFLAVRDGQAIESIKTPAQAVWAAHGQVALCRWGEGSCTYSDTTMMIVSRTARDIDGSVPMAKLAELMASDPGALTQLLPPFGAVRTQAGHATIIADAMGFQHMFHTRPGASLPPALSNSSLVLGRTFGAAIDTRSVAVQSLLGWQLGQRTLFTGIEKLSPGASAQLTGSGVNIIQAPPDHFVEMDLERAVERAATRLRRSVTAVLDDYPDAVLQLTGGMDSRLLLSAIPEGRRQGLRAMTLDVPGSMDASIARDIARRYGLRHVVHDLANVARLSPAEAWELCFGEAVRLDAMADPIALAAQRVGERAFEQGVRLSGLGGEMARGFYYFGRVRDRPYTRTDVERLASWRMFVNEAVEPGLLTANFSAWARKVAFDELHNALLRGGTEWFRATDHLYARHRMQRWAGATDGAVSDQRMVLNPMLDAGFLEIVSRLSPRDKAGSRFLAALQMELDPELGRRPLDGRPAPVAYLNPPRWQAVSNGFRLGHRIARKVGQRLKRNNRSPAGGDVLASKVVDYLRGHVELITPLSSLGLINEKWIDDMLTKRLEPSPSSVAFITNLIVLKSFDANAAISVGGMD